MILNNSQYDSILRTYESTQLDNRKLLEQRRESVYARIPELASLQHAISDLGISQARKMLNGDEGALEEHRKEIARLKQQKAELLAAAGYPADYLEPIYNCPDCRDTGYIGSKKCHCFEKAIIDLLYAQSNLKNILAKENFDTFSFAYYSDNHIDPITGRSSFAIMKDAYFIAKDFVTTFQTEFRNLLLYGDTGVGKTFLSNCIAKALIDQGFSVIYFTSYDLFDTLSKGIFGKDHETGRISEHILNCDLLIIDDLGAELTNAFTSSQLFLCLNERLLHQKSTIISTNLSLETIKDLYSERTLSRITSNYIQLKLTGDDIRIKKKLMKWEDM